MKFSKASNHPKRCQHKFKHCLKASEVQNSVPYFRFNRYTIIHVRVVFVPVDTEMKEGIRSKLTLSPETTQSIISYKIRLSHQRRKHYCCTVGIKRLIQLFRPYMVIRHLRSNYRKRQVCRRIQVFLQGFPGCRLLPIYNGIQ